MVEDLNPAAQPHDKLAQQRGDQYIASELFVARGL